ncbi:hypothetical protein CEP15_07915 [Cylindrospermopsis raciborskii C07]|uniref:Uncharacterized protein n=1 Tax=Cylindrospermopsis raciborskii C07 TaxID=2014886 RepID=A0ABX4WM25_9CYAN|nr:hypothetical protein CEP15_07915 [Cylindrospermopsis raciborskii C07]
MDPSIESYQNYTLPSKAIILKCKIVDIKIFSLYFIIATSSEVEYHGYLPFCQTFSFDRVMMG